MNPPDRLFDNPEHFFHIYTDGGARGNPGPAAIAYVILDAGRKLVERGARTIGTATNNEAEYNALIWALERALALSRGKIPGGISRLRCHMDSELVARQMSMAYKVREPRLKALHMRALSLAVGFGLGAAEFISVPRTDPVIKKADRLLNAALDRDEKIRYINKLGPGAGEPPRGA